MQSVQYLTSNGEFQYAAIEEVIANRIDFQKSMDHLKTALGHCVSTNDDKYLTFKNDLISKIYKLEESISDNYASLNAQSQMDINSFKEKLEAFKIELIGHQIENFESLYTTITKFNDEIAVLKNIMEKDNSVKYMLEHYRENNN